MINSETKNASDSLKLLSEKIFVFISLFIFLFDFREFAYTNISSKNQICWPHWTNCTSLSLPNPFPFGYENSLMFALLLGAVVFAIWSLLENKRRFYISALAALTVFKVFYHFFWYYSEYHNFDYFHLFPTIAFLLGSKNRIFSAQVAFCLLYFSSAFVKIHESWIVGTYFTSLDLGLPFFNNNFAPFISQFVIPFEIFGSWLLLSSRYKKYFFWLWILFHLYSAVLVGYFYPVRCILILFALFYESKSFALTELSLKIKSLSYLVVSFFALYVFFQAIPLAYSEDNKVSLRFEGYALNQFDSNYQCESYTKLISQDNSFTESVIRQTSARERCSPRNFLFKIQKNCSTPNLKSINWVLKQSINGHAFYELVNTQNACDLTFSLFGTNAWLKTEQTTPIGFPHKNSVTNDWQQKNNSSQIIFSENTIELSETQQFFLNHLPALKLFYYSLWFLVLGFVLSLFFALKNNIHFKKTR